VAAPVVVGIPRIVVSSLLPLHRLPVPVQWHMPSAAASPPIIKHELLKYLSALAEPSSRRASTGPKTPATIKKKVKGDEFLEDGTRPPMCSQPGINNQGERVAMQACGNIRFTMRLPHNTPPAVTLSNEVPASRALILASASPYMV